MIDPFYEFSGWMGKGVIMVEPVDILSEPDSLTEVMGGEPVDQELWVEPVDMVSEPVDMVLEPVDMVVL